MNKKKIAIAAGVTLALAGALVGGLFAASHLTGNKSVYVYNFDIVGMDSFWGDQQESYGPVRSDNIQTVMLSDTQTVTEIKVKEGDRVKKGDLLMSYDTTLSDLALEKKRLAVEQLKLQLIQENRRLGELLDTPPYTPSYDYGDDDGDDWGGGGSDDDWQEPEETIQEFTVKTKGERNEFSTANFTGCSKLNPIICLMPKGSISLKEENLQKVKAVIEEKRQIAQAVNYADVPESEYAITEYYAVLKATSDDFVNSDNVLWQGIYVVFADDTYRMTLFDASAVTDYTRDNATPTIPTVDVSLPKVSPLMPEEADNSPRYTREQLTQMIEEQRKKILEVEYQIKVAEAEYSIAQREMKDGGVYAEVDGKVVSVLSQEEARERNQPVVKVSGGGGFYIAATISELSREKLAVGTEVTVIDQRSGGVYTGRVESVGDFPASGGINYGSGNPNVTYYPFTVFVDESADLVTDNYVWVQYGLEGEKTGIYLSNPFVRKEKGEAYVYVQGTDGKLEKRVVRTGKSVWGSYTEVLSGVTKEDLFAFPYGKSVKPGAVTAKGDYSTLYDQQ